MKKTSLQKKNNIEKIGVIAIIVSIFFVSIGYSSFRRDLPISNIVAYVDVEVNIKVKSFTMLESSSPDSYSNSVEHSNTSISTNIHLNDASSWVKYEIYVVNIGNEEMGIANILETTLPDNLTYEISHYNLKEPICDEMGDNCTLDAKEKIDIKIKYKDGVTITNPADYQVLLEFDFEPFYDVTYDTGTCTGTCPTKALGNTSFNTTLSKYATLIIKMNEVTLKEDDYKINSDTGYVIINKVMGDINFSNKPYKRIEYIESTSATDEQYIDIDYIPNNKTKVIFDGFTIDGDTALIGSRILSTGNQKYTLQYVSGNLYRFSFYNKDYLAAASFVKGIRHVFTIDANEFLIDNSLIKIVDSNSVNLFDSSYSLYVFAVNNSNNPSNFGINRTYGIKIYENDELVRNYIPALDSDDIPCLYETINNKFYYNKGKGAFKTNEGDYYTVTDNVDNIFFTNTNTNVKFSDSFTTYLTHDSGFELPEKLLITSNGITLTENEDYTYDFSIGKLTIFEVTGNIIVNGASTKQIPYIQSTGTQFIDTKYKPTVNTKVVLTYIPIKESDSNWSALFGCRKGSNNTEAFYYSTGTGNVSVWLGSYHVSSNSSNSNIPYKHILNKNEVVTLSSSQFTVVVDGETKLSYSIDPTKVSFNNPNSIYIFGRNVGGSVNYPSAYKFVSLQIYEDNILVRDFVPIHDIDGQYGLFDTILDQYYYNLGTGTFIE